MLLKPQNQPMRDTHCPPISQMRRGRLREWERWVRGHTASRDVRVPQRCRQEASGRRLSIIAAVVAAAGPWLPLDQEIPPAYLGGELASLPLSNPLTYNPSLMPLEEAALNRNQLRPLPLSASQALPFKGLTRLPNPPQGPNAIVSLLQLCWEAWLLGGEGHLWESSRPGYQAWEETGGHKLSTYYVLGKMPPMKKPFVGVNDEETHSRCDDRSMGRESRYLRPVLR